MLRTLLESARPHSIPLGSLVASIAVHVVLSLPAWKGMPEEQVMATPESFITRALFLPPPDRVASRAAGGERLSWAALGAAGGQTYFLPDAPRSSMLGAGALPTGVPEEGRRSADEGPGNEFIAGNDSVYSILQVDEVVARYPDSGAPIYPGELLQKAIEGSVRVRYVVDASGRVDSTTVQVLRSNHPQFSRAVRDALKSMRFVPATIAAQPVSQVVEQDFMFRIDRPQSDTLGTPPSNRPSPVDGAPAAGASSP